METYQDVSTKPEVADVFRTVYGKGSSFSELSPDKRKVVRSITACRTASLGGHISICNECGYREQSYNSCWNRHCPKCQGGKAFSWVEARREELLPVPYFHLVFTLPKELRALCYQNKKELYDILFRASSEAIQEAARTRHNATVGHFGVLHSWNQELTYHPHVHHIVCGAGLSDDESSVIPFGNERFFLPVRVLSKLFRGKFISYLKAAYRKNELRFFHDLSHLKNPQAFEHLCSQATTHDWVVYAKRPFGGPEQVLKYLASYVHRVGISSARLVKVTSNEVTFTARHKTKKSKRRAVTITPKSFCHRFLLHLLPRGYKRIRYFGLFLNRKRKANIKQMRTLLNALPPEIPISPHHPHTCPHCSRGLLATTLLIKPHSSIKPRQVPSVPYLNSA